ncbi:hypothetical protein AB0I02_11145 [Streptomyces phaeochromogenes]
MVPSTRSRRHIDRAAPTDVTGNGGGGRAWTAHRVSPAHLGLVASTAHLDSVPRTSHVTELYVPHQALEDPFDRIAEVPELSEANARQLSLRAPGHLPQQRHNRVDPADRDTLLPAFLDAARACDIAHLIDLLQGLRILSQPR